MDTTGKIGLGGVFFGAAVALVPWLWPAAPRVLGEAGLGLILLGAIWGFSPIFKALFSRGGSFTNIPMHKAARIAYEISERNLVG